jgi:hypothetical protein
MPFKDHRHEERIRKVICKAMKPRKPVSFMEACLSWTLIGAACGLGFWFAYMTIVFVWAK